MYCNCTDPWPLSLSAGLHRKPSMRKCARWKGERSEVRMTTVAAEYEHMDIQQTYQDSVNNRWDDEWDNENSSARLFERSRIKALAGEDVTRGAPLEPWGVIVSAELKNIREDNYYYQEAFFHAGLSSFKCFTPTRTWQCFCVWESCYGLWKNTVGVWFSEAFTQFKIHSSTQPWDTEYMWPQYTGNRMHYGKSFYQDVLFMILNASFCRS